MVDFKNIKDSLKEYITDMISYDAKASAEEIAAKKRKLIIGAGAVFALFIICFTMIGFSLRVPANAEVNKNKDVVYVRVAPGMGSDAIGKMLVEKGVISSSTKFWIASKLNGADAKFRVGTFAMNKDMTAGEAISVLLNSKTVAMRVTIPEGFNVKDIAKRLDEQGICDEKEFLKLAKTYAPYSYMEKNPAVTYTVEGFLFPDTYEFSSDATAEDVMKRMIDEFDHKVTPEMRKQAAARNISIYELATMASLIEKEALYDSDLSLISQIFWKRIKINMPLQSCATIQYILGEPKEDLSVEDTKIDSPYNTYQNYGLPPGPIANAGLRSLKAVLEPADTDYLYFVADRNGNTYYTNTFDEHLAKADQVR